MSADKYPIAFSSQLEAIVFIILQIFFATRAVFLNWRVSFGYLPVLAGEYSGIYLTRLDQSRASENI